MTTILIKFNHFVFTVRLYITNVTWDIETLFQTFRLLGFLTDKQIAAAIPLEAKGPRSLLPWQYFVDDDQDCDLDSLMVC